MFDDRVFETTTTTDAPTLILAGAQPGYRSFSGRRRQPVLLQDRRRGRLALSEGRGGTFASGSPNTLQRTIVSRSSDSDNLVTLPSGIKRDYIAPLSAASALTRDDHAGADHSRPEQL
jgi:hypothetical protein